MTLTGGQTPSAGLSLPHALAARAESSAAGGACGSDGLSDAEAVRRTLAGEMGAFETIVLRYERAIYAHLLRMVRRPEDAEDLAQETFLRALRGLDGYRNDQPLRPWLYRIATNAAISARRRRGPSVVSLDDPEGAIEKIADPRPESAAERLSREQTLARIEETVAALPPAEAAIFNLRYREGMSLEEIGAATGRKHGAVGVALHRLRIRLRESIFGSRIK